MIRNFILASAVAAFALTGGSLAVTGNAFAKDGKNSFGGGSSHVMRLSNEVHRDRDHSDTHRDRDYKDVRQRDRDHDRSYVYRHDHDHSRHFWHGTWWEYGVGSCWRWSDDYDEYVWACE